MRERILSLVIGYLFGCFLTAELVAHRYAGKSASELGDTGNPGMANIMASLGFVPGILTLAGDLGKCVASALLSYFLFPAAGWIVTLYAGLGCTLGHNYPFWRKLRGGKGVATSSMAICIYSFFPGLISNLIGMLTVFATKYLCIGGPAIPLSFMIWMWIKGNREAAVLSTVLTILSILAHGPSILGIRKGETKQDDVLGALCRKLRKTPPAEK